MTPEFSVQTTSHFERALKKLSRRHVELSEHHAHILPVLRTGPYNSRALTLSGSWKAFPLVRASTESEWGAFASVTTSKVKWFT